MPRLRARLRECLAAEAALERELAGRGVDAGAIGPRVPAGTALDPTPKPGEGDEPKRAFPPLPPQRSLLERILSSLTGRAR